MRAAIRYASEREKDGILMPDDVDEKSGDLVSEVLASKHPIGRDVEISSLPIFESYPELINIEVTEDSVEKVARGLSGSAGPSGIDSVAMSHWLLKFGGASSKLRRSIAKFVEWLANDYPPWAAYRAMTWSRLVGLDKCPGVRPIGIGDILRRLLCKTLLIVVGKEATRACGTDQLCSGLEAGIEGGIHHMRSMWDEHEGDEEEWGVLLIDAKNAFNEGNRKMMLWVIRHKWPSCARFVFNIYRHQSVLVVRGESGKKLFSWLVARDRHRRVR